MRLKSIVTFLLISFTTSNAFAAIDLMDFHNRNFNVTGNDKCGVHLEVSGNKIIFTDIIPPMHNDTRNDFCRRYAGCKGASYAVTCQENGTCYYDKNNELAFLLLANGNIHSYAYGVKAIRSERRDFYMCR